MGCAVVGAFRRPTKLQFYTLLLYGTGAANHVGNSLAELHVRSISLPLAGKQRIARNETLQAKGCKTTNGLDNENL